MKTIKINENGQEVEYALVPVGKVEQENKFKIWIQISQTLKYDIKRISEIKDTLPNSMLSRFIEDLYQSDINLKHCEDYLYQLLEQTRTLRSNTDTLIGELDEEIHNRHISSINTQ